MQPVSAAAEHTQSSAQRWANSLTPAAVSARMHRTTNSTCSEIRAAILIPGVRGDPDASAGCA